MIHHGRCGSTVLASLLKQNPKIHWANELYMPVFMGWQLRNNGVEVVGEMVGDPIRILKRSMTGALNKYYGFEVKPFHLKHIGYTTKDYVEKLESLSFDHFIILERKNKLRSIVSSIIAHQHENMYHLDTNEKPKVKKAYVDIDEVRVDFNAQPLIKYLEEYEEQMQHLRELLKEKNLLVLTYEEDIQSDPVDAYSKICVFLNLKCSDVLINYGKTNPYPLREMIENFDEVQSELKGTSFEWMLYE